MPKYIKDTKEFLKTLSSHVIAKEPKQDGDKKVERPKTQFKHKIIIKHSKNQAKFKLRTSKYLYTTIVKGTNKINEIIKKLPNNLVKEEIKKDGKSKKK